MHDADTVSLDASDDSGDGVASASAGDDTVEAGTIRTNDIETYYERRGEGPPVVFLHAAIMDTRMWETQVDALSDAYTTITYDVRGHGRTGGSENATYSADLYAADLDALLTELGVERPVLCGLSMGGMIAQAYAATYPEKVAGLVLADTFTPGALGMTGRLLFLNDQFVALLSSVVSYKRLNRLKLRLGDRLLPGVSGDVETVQRLVDEGPTMSPAELRKVIDSLAAFVQSDFDVSRVTAPTLVLYGEHEPAPLRDMAAHLHDRLAGAGVDVTLTVVPDAGHASNLDNPAFFTDAVRTLAGRVTDGEANGSRSD